MIKCRSILVAFVLVLALLTACNNHEKNEAVTKEAESISENESTEGKMDRTEKNTEQDNIQEDDPYHEHTEKKVFDDGEIYCVEIRDDYSDPRALHPIVEIEHHTYDKKTNVELTLLDVTGMASDEAADEIRKLLKENYPFFYDEYWGNHSYIEYGETKIDFYEMYRDYYNSLDPLTLDFCPNENNEILVYDSWGLPYGDNTNGHEVYVTLHRG